MTLEVYVQHWEHPDGKGYLNCLVRDDQHNAGQTIHFKMWGKSVFDDFSAGQLQYLVYDEYYEAVDKGFSKEEDKRRQHGYILIGSRHWQTLNSYEANNLDMKGLDVLGEFSTLIAMGARPTVPNQTPVPRADEVPSGTMTPAKRLEWIVSHEDHPQVVDQMMKTIEQLVKKRVTAQQALESTQTDLEFAQAWMRNRFTQQGGA